MNDEPNKKVWQKGDIVIHDADAKDKDMLMVITGYDPETNRYYSKYLNPDYTKSRLTYKNELKCLHDPARFGIEVSFTIPDFSSELKWLDTGDHDLIVECKTQQEAEKTLTKACHLLDVATHVMSDGSERKQEIKEFFEDIGYPSLTFE